MRLLVTTQIATRCVLTATQRAFVSARSFAAVAVAAARSADGVFDVRNIRFGITAAASSSGILNNILTARRPLTSIIDHNLIKDGHGIHF